MDYISMLSLSGLSLACSQRPRILFLSCILLFFLHFFSILSLEQGFQSALGAITGGGPARGQKAVGGGYRIGQDLKLYRIQIQIQNTEYRTLNTDTEYNGKCYDKSRVRVGLCILHRPSSSCAPMPVRSAWPHGDALNSTQLNSTPAPPDFKITRTAGIKRANETGFSSSHRPFHRFHGYSFFRKLSGLVSCRIHPPPPPTDGAVHSLIITCHLSLT